MRREGGRKERGRQKGRKKGSEEERKGGRGG